MLTNINIIGNRKIFLSIAAALVAAAVLAIIIFKFQPGVDFSGGALIKFKVGGSVDAETIQKYYVEELKFPETRVSYDPMSGSYLARLPGDVSSEHERIDSEIKKKFSDYNEESFQSIGPSIGAELRRKSIIAIILVLLGISFYIAYAFRKVFRPISSWKYGWVTLLTLFHDVIIPAGLLAVLGRFGGVEIDGNFVVALLVVMGFSVHDTIVVFDRIRENLVLDRGKSEFSQIINRSVNETIARSINTSLTLILVLLALYFMGPDTLRYFILTLLVGVVIGIYSSVFVASPLLLVWHGWSTRHKTS
ncbi:MAG: protein translocase subunit SecF [Candidatus Liptonbacteria bacterium]